MPRRSMRNALNSARRKCSLRPLGSWSMSTWEERCFRNVLRFPLQYSLENGDELVPLIDQVTFQDAQLYQVSDRQLSRARAELTRGEKVRDITCRSLVQQSGSLGALPEDQTDTHLLGLQQTQTNPSAKPGAIQLPQVKTVAIPAPRSRSLPLMVGQDPVHDEKEGMRPLTRRNALIDHPDGLRSCPLNHAGHVYSDGSSAAPADSADM